MKFDRRFFSNLFVFVLLIVIGIVISTFQANKTVKFAFSDEIMAVSSRDCNMNIQYANVTALELADDPDLGALVDGKNRPELQSGTWKNDLWGEYRLIFNPNATNCIVVHMANGETYVFSCNTNKETAEVYQKLLTHIP